MAREDVNIKVSADVAEAIRMWRAMEKGPEGMARELDAAGKKGKAAATGMESAFGSLVGKWGSIAAGIKLAKDTLAALISAQREYNELVKNASTPVDTFARRFQVQGGLSNQQGAEARRQILNIAQKRGSLPETAFPAATQMVSSGWSPEQVLKGGGLNEFLKLMNASNATGREINPMEMAKNLTLFMEANQQEKTGPNVAALTRSIQSLFKSTNIQTVDLGLFSKEAGKINQLFPELQNRQLALLSQFEGVTDTASAGTVLRKALLSIRTAKAVPKKMKALKDLGVDFSEVDNESFLQVQDTMTNAFTRADPVAANLAAKRLFGEEALLARQVIFSPQGRNVTRERFALGSDEAAYARDVAITEGGVEGRGRAAKTGEYAAFADPNFVSPETIKNILNTRGQEQGHSALSQFATRSAFDFYNLVPGFNEQDALRATLGPGAEGTFNSIMQEARPTMPQDLPSQNVSVKIQLTDQDRVAIPHKSDVSKLNKSK